MTMTSRRRCAALAACVAASAVPAMADPPLTTGDTIHASRRVGYNYAELNSAQGVPSLAARLKGAATSVCVRDRVIVPTGPDDVPDREAANDRDLTTLKPPCFPTSLVGLLPAALPSLVRHLAPDPRRNEAGIGRSGSVRGTA